MANDIVFLGLAYGAMIGLIGWFSWQLYVRMEHVNKRLESVEILLKKED
tara:strand:- start:1936 stop:2082 length:147 start_codon:yes stop_codon:yes gene_type:complete